MKPLSRPPRAPSKLSYSVHHQLNMYALAASAAGVGVLASGSPAEAKVVYTPATANMAIRMDCGPVGLDLNHDGIIDFQLGIFRSSGSCQAIPLLGPHSHPWFVISPVQQSNGVWSVQSTFSGNQIQCVAALPKGTRVGSHSPFRMGTWQVLYGQSNGSWGTAHFCPWRKGVQAYLGLEFVITGKIHFGWARVASNGVGTAYVSGYAYESVPGKAIVTGKIKGPDVVTVQPDTAPGSLARLARGRN